VSQADASAANSTSLAKPGRASVEHLADQMRRSLDDPCVKVFLDVISGFVMIQNEYRLVDFAPIARKILLAPDIACDIS
jgi:hypothetical protein